MTIFFKGNNNVELLLKEATEVLEIKAGSEEESFPFKMYRSSMYTQEELLRVDQSIYQFHVQTANTSSLAIRKAKQMHDFTIKLALQKALKGRKVVVFYGSHSLKRASEMYRDVVLLSKVRYFNFL